MTAQPSHPGPPRPHAGGYRVADVQLRGRSGPLPARGYWPLPSLAVGRPPLLVLLPAGGGRDGVGWTDARARGLCRHVGAVVLSVGYRPPPGGRDAVEDAVTATWWAEDHASELGADPGCLLVAGEGAGARLAVAVARRARDDGWPPLARQVLLCAELGDGLPHEDRLPDGDGRPDEDGLHGLAAAIMVTAGPDSHGVAARLRGAGVDVDELRYDDVGPSEVLAPGGGPLTERIAQDLARSLGRSTDEGGAAWS